MAKIVEIEGIGEKLAATLEGAGVATVEALLATAGTAKGREELANKTGLKASQILEWVNRADLMRVKGVGSEYSDLLEAAGVDTVKELATRRPDNLHAKLLEVLDLAGRRVWSAPVAPHSESLEWSGRTNGARASGVFFARYTQGKTRVTQRFVLLK